MLGCRYDQFTTSCLFTMHCACTCMHRDAKLCVLEWDSLRHELRTTSMHYFEGDPGLREGKKVGEGTNLSALLLLLLVLSYGGERKVETGACRAVVASTVCVCV